MQAIERVGGSQRAAERRIVAASARGGARPKSRTARSGHTCKHRNAAALGRVPGSLQLCGAMPKRLSNPATRQ